MSQQKAIIILCLNVVLSSFASAQYGSAAGSGNVGYGGKGTSVPSGDYGHQAQDSSASSSGSAPDGNSEPEPFNFSYQVKDEPTYTDFKHEANSDGKRVTGEYSVLLPDGRNQIVTYTADENGYNAKINYVGEARPQPAQPASSAGAYKSAAAPAYPSSVPAYASAAPAYPSSAPSYSSSAPGGYSSAGSSYSSSASGGYSSAAPSYPSLAPSGYPSAPPSYSAGVKTSYAAPQPKNGGY